MAAKEALCAEAETLAESEQWKATGDRLKEIVEEWRTIKGIDRKTDDALWKRFAKARDAFTRHRGTHFADLDKQRGAAKEAKEALIARAEALAESTEWGRTAGEYRTLMEEWKASGRAPRDVEDALWDRFRAAQEKFFSHRHQTFSERDQEFETNAAIKETLLAEAELINPSGGLDAAKAALRSIQERWEAAGKVPRERIKEFDSRLRAVEDRIRSAEDSHWRRTDPETTARIEQFPLAGRDLSCAGRQGAGLGERAEGEGSRVAGEAVGGMVGGSGERCGPVSTTATDHDRPDPAGAAAAEQPWLPDDAGVLADRIRALHRPGSRVLIGIVGAPGSGKSTLSADLISQLATGPAPLAAALVAMDGYHLAQHVLDTAGLADIKGAPQTFDAAGYVALLERITGDRHGDEVIYAPEFRRALEEPIAGAVPVGPDAEVVLTEGNYLLSDESPWHRGPGAAHRGLVSGRTGGATGRTPRLPAHRLRPDTGGVVGAGHFRDRRPQRALCGPDQNSCRPAHPTGAARVALNRALL